VKLRAARPGDEAAIAEVHVRTWQAAYRGQIPDDFLDSLSIEERTGMWQQIIAESAAPECACMVAEEGDRIVGFTHLCPSRDEGAGPRTGELATIYLLEEHWNTGLGRGLLDRAVAQLTEAGFDAATLWVLDTNLRAQRFYETAGWAPDGATQVSDRGAFSLLEVRYRRELPMPSDAPADVGPDLFRMPVAFGPYPGPRQRPEGGRWATSERCRSTSIALRWLSDAVALERLLPPALQLDGEPTVAISITQLEDVPWLGGRAYNMAVVSVPVRYSGGETLAGDFELVTWENRTEPIISGRDELGFNKVFGEVSDVEVSPDGTAAMASIAWDGFVFLEMAGTGLVEPVDTPAGPRRPLLHRRYVPAIGEWGQADVDRMTGGGFEPDPYVSVVEAKVGQGSITIRPGTFEELPTLAHIVGPLAELPCHRVFGATFTRSKGFADLYDTRVLR
jgi:GNAT superfamily N-acetyltransferase